jgi:uncharacterized membrane protein
VPIITGIVAVVIHPYGDSLYGRRALDILQERFAKGEIDKAEFEEKRRLLGR